MSSPVDFYFDFASPCGYIAAEQIEALVAKDGRTAAWHGIAIDANFHPHDPIHIPAGVMRSDDVQRDAARTAAFYGVPISQPSQQGLHTVLAARGVSASPFFIVAGERFWDVSRMPQLERRLASGTY
jgi:2-hydroxychromene-2-carboxylate isomerase